MKNNNLNIARVIIQEMIIREVKGDNLHQLINYVAHYGRPGQLSQASPMPDWKELSKNRLFQHDDFWFTDTYEYEDFAEENGFDKDDVKCFELFKAFVMNDAAETLAYQLKPNERGLLYVERNITVPHFSEIGNTFDYLVDEYGGHLGVCWSYKHGQIINCGVDGDEVSLKGFVDPGNVDWQNTMELCFIATGTGEDELRLKYNVPVEINQITAVSYNRNEHVIWNKPVIMRS